MPKWSMHNPKSVLENEMPKLLWDFEIQTDHLVAARRLNLVIVIKRTSRIVDFAVPVDPREKLKESEKRDNYLDLARELEKTIEHENDGDTNCNGRARYSHQRIFTGTGRLEIRGRVETTQTITLMILAKILRRVIETWGDLLSFRLQ